MNVHPMLIVANWKMNPRTFADAKTLLLSLRTSLAKLPDSTSVVIAPPVPFLGGLSALLGKSRFTLGAQNVAPELLGALTGEVSVSMVQSFGATHVIVGHSERRARGETDSDVQKKVALTVKAGLTPIVCVGESERDSAGKYFGFVEGQVRSAFTGIAQSKLAHIVIAYEPIWAISTATANAHPATPEDAHEMVLFIRKVLTELYGRAGAARVRILYGGSVTEKNCGALVSGSGAGGFLVGGASLRSEEFTSIVRATYVR